MSPEQARGEDAMPVSDLYALGILFFEMTTGQLPFRSADRDTLLEMQKTAASPKPRTIAKDLPEVAERIILRLLEKDPRNRFRDGHHLQEELKAFQRTLPSTWEVQSPDAAPPAQPPPPPPAPTPGVVEWSRRAAYYSRMIARAYPNGRVPEELQHAGDQLWEVSARASRLEGELASHQRKLDAIERRGRALRAEIGRKVEDLAEEESRTLRDAAAERERIAKLAQRIEKERAIHEANAREMQALERAAGDLARWRVAFEAATAGKSKAEVLSEVVTDSDRRAQVKEKSAQDLRRQIDELRAQLQRYGDALENDLAAGRERIATRVREALSYEKTFMESSALLLNHLRGRPECAELLDEMRREEAQFAMGSQPSAAKPPGDQTGAFKAVL
jgi:serine/threonine-protein kinase